MIANLRETTQINAEQDWLKTNLARHLGHAPGPARPRRRSPADHERGHAAVVNAQHGAFFLVEPATDGDDRAAPRRLLRLPRRDGAADRFRSARGWSGRRRSRASRSGSTTSLRLPQDRLGPRATPPPARPRRAAGALRGAGARRDRARRRCRRSARSTGPSWSGSRTPSASCSTRSRPTCAPRSCWPSPRRWPGSCRSSPRELHRTNAELEDKARAAVRAEPQHRDQERRDRERPRAAWRRRRPSSRCARSTSRSSWPT